MFLFPFEKVCKNSKVILYGAGEAGVQFYSQIKSSRYCEVTHWIDKKYGRSADHFFILPEELTRTEFDAVIIATGNRDIAEEMIQECLKYKVDRDRIICGALLEQGVIKIPQNRELFQENARACLEIAELFYLNKQQFGEGNFYQSYDRMGIIGQRPTRERIKKYRILNFAERQDRVLDIGCNCGFFDLQLAEHVNQIVGIDINKTLIEIAQKTKKIVNDQKCFFLAGDFKTFKSEDKFHIIMAYAVIYWIHMGMEQFVDKIDGLLEHGGYLVLESHSVYSEVRLNVYREYVRCFCRQGYSLWSDGLIKDDGKIEREFCILRKGIK